MRQVAFIRNVNQGQRGHPSSTDLVAAFEAAGGRAVEAFQSNGTIVFDSSATDVVERAMAALAEATGHQREGFGMPLEELAGIVDAHATEDAARCELTLHGGGIVDLGDSESSAQAARRRCTLVAAGPGWLVTANERDRESNATPVAERLTGTAATSRGLPTLVRLVDRFAD